MRIERFTVEVGGRQYKCERRESGVRKVTQLISVEGIGVKPDLTIYGESWSPIGAISVNARIIAREIIEGC